MPGIAAHISLLACLFVVFVLSPLLAAENTCPGRVLSETVYVPAYSHIYHGNKETPLLLSVTLSIRNIDPVNSITITRVDYYETQGTFLKSFIEKPLLLGPLGSDRLIVPQKDSTGGSGANFIVVWHADQPTTPPIMETVMIGTQNQFGISFTSRGRAIVNE